MLVTLKAWNRRQVEKKIEYPPLVLAFDRPTSCFVSTMSRMKFTIFLYGKYIYLWLNITGIRFKTDLTNNEKNDVFLG